MKRYLPFVIIALVLIGALGIGYFMLKPKGPASSGSAGADPPHVRGGAQARILIEEFGDFQCPPCAKFHPDLKKIEAEFGDKIRVVFRHFPIQQIHPHAQVAARAAEAAGFQGKFWEMHDMIYESQPAWNNLQDARTAFIAYAGDLRLDVERFKKDMEGPEATARVAADFKRGQSLGVEGTPTVFVNGTPLSPDATSVDGLRKAINYLLNNPGK